LLLMLLLLLRWRCCCCCCSPPYGARAGDEHGVPNCCMAAAAAAAAGMSLLLRALRDHFEARYCFWTTLSVYVGVSNGYNAVWVIPTNKWPPLVILEAAAAAAVDGACWVRRPPLFAVGRVECTAQRSDCWLRSSALPCAPNIPGKPPHAGWFCNGPLPAWV